MMLNDETANCGEPHHWVNSRRTLSLSRGSSNSTWIACAFAQRRAAGPLSRKRHRTFNLNLLCAGDQRGPKLRGCRARRWRYDQLAEERVASHFF